MKYNIKIMQDSSEVIPYDLPGLPLYVKETYLSVFSKGRALCHWHEELELIRVKEGEMNYRINGKKVPLKEGDCILVNSGQMHYGYTAGNQDCRFQCVLCHPKLLAGNSVLYRKYFLPVQENEKLEYLYFPEGRNRGVEMGRAMEDISQLSEKKSPGYELVAVGILTMLWGRLLENFEMLPWESASPADPDLSAQRNMVSYIYRHYGEKLTLSAIAESGGVCRSKCCEIFKKYLQQSPIDFLNHYRIEASANLLAHTQLSVTEIGLSCGFNHPSYYSKLFAQNYGCTPGEYRKRRKKTKEITN